MDTQPPSKIVRDKDRISALPDELLLGIIERLALPEAVRTGAVSTRWRHLPHQLSHLDLNVGDFKGTTPLEAMDAFTAAMCRLLSVCQHDCNSRRAVKILRLRFYSSVPHLGTIGRAVEDTVSRGETEHFGLVTLKEFGHKFLTFSHICPTAFRWLTELSLTSLAFGDSDLPILLGACDKLKYLSLRSCILVGHSVLTIDTPKSAIQELEFNCFSCTRIELVSVPKLTRLSCRSWCSKNHPLYFGYVPELLKVDIASRAKAWQAPFALSQCFSMNTRSLSKLYLNFVCQRIWIQPEHPKQLTAIFSNLTDVTFWHIFPECDLSWTLFILDAAPALQNFVVNRARHFCVKEDNAEKANMAWEPSKNLKHLNLKSMLMIGFEEEDKVVNYIRLVMERATGLKRIVLGGNTCEACHDTDLESPRRSEVDKASRRRIKERLANGSSSSVKIIISSQYIVK